MRGNRTTRGHSGLQALLLSAAALLTLTAAPAFAQAPADYRSADPRALLRALPGAPPETRAEIAAAMAARRTQVLPTLWDAARFGDRAEKMLACSLIAELRDRDGVDALVDASADADVRVRRRAATALRILADRRAAPRLRALLGGEADLGVLKTALAGLGRIGLARDAQAIAPFLAHADLGVRVVAAGALALLGDEQGLALVLQATDAGDPGVQKSATYVLGFFAAPAAAARLQAIVDDPQGAWKAYALIALTERQLAAQPPATQAATLAALARRSGRSRTQAEWAVDRLTDLGTPQAAAALRALSDRPTPVGRLAARRLLALEAQP